MNCMSMRCFLVILFVIGLLAIVYEYGGEYFLSHGLVLFKDHQYEAALWYLAIAAGFPNSSERARFYYGLCLIRLRSFGRAELFISSIVDNNKLKGVLTKHLSDARLQTAPIPLAP